MPQHTLAHIKMKIKGQRSHKTVFVVVEGNDDLTFYKKFFDSQVSAMYPATKLNDNGEVQEGGCRELQNIVSTVLHEGHTEQIIGIMDTDNRRFLANYVYPPNIFHTDRRDMEMTVLSTLSIQRELDGWFGNFNQRLKTLEPVLRHAGVLRILNEKFRLGCNFKKYCKINCVFDESAHKLYDDWRKRYDKTFFKACFKKRHLSVLDKLTTFCNIFKAEINIFFHSYDKESVFDVCQGHDTISLLSLSLVKTSVYSKKAIWDRCVDTYSIDDFRNSSLFVSIDRWQSRLELSIIRKR